MSKVTTTYDNTLKEKIFIVKGEEGYARSTDCILTELYTNNGERRNDWDTSLDYMKLEFRIDVLRDVGASQVVLYDNDTTIGVYDFDTNTHSIDLKYESPNEDNRLTFSYDVEHHIYAKYMGNKQCMKSQSQSYKLFEPMPDKFQCELAFIDMNGEVISLENNNVDYDSVRYIPLGVQLTAQSYVAGNNIKIYDGDNLLVEGNTDSEGIFEFPLENDGSFLENRAYHLKAFFEGSQYLESKTTNVSISVGYVVSVEEYPSVRINNEPIDIVAKVQSYLGNPPSTRFSNAPYTVRGDSQGNYEFPDTEGYLYFTNIMLNRPYFTVGLNDVIDVDYVSDEYIVPFYNSVNLSLSTNSLIIAPNYSATLTAQVSRPIPDIPISFNGNNVMTNNGIARYTVEGEGIGDVTVTASIYDSSESITIEDVIQYWSKTNGSLGLNYRDRYGSTTSLTNGWRGTPSQTTYLISFPFSVDFIVMIEFNVKGVNGLVGIGEDNTPITGVKTNDVIKGIYDINNQRATFYLNNNVIGTSDCHGVDLRLHFMNNNGYILFDELKIKRMSD